MEKKRSVLFNDDFESQVKRGVDVLANAVKTTMGPKGRLVLIQRGNAHPTVTKDGVTVAQAVNLENEVENLGVKVIKEAASRTAEEAGDGTTTATVLAQSIFNEGMKMKAAGFQTDLIVAGIREATEVVKKSLFSQKREVKDQKDLMHVAKISANGEEHIARLIVKALKVSGADGSVIVEEAKGFKSTLTVVDGFRLERGYLSPYFVTDKNKMTCEYENCLVLMADKEFNSIHDLMKPLELALEAGRPILIVANEIDNEALQGLVVNKLKGSLRICAIKSPGFGATRHDLLQDLNSVVGGTLIDASFDVNNFKLEDFGNIKKVIAGKNHTMLVSGNKKSVTDSINGRVSSIRKRLADPATEPDELELLNYRLQQLSGGISILRIGAATESEMIERYDRVDDALSATRAAMQEGILPGGGVAYVRSLPELKKEKLKVDTPDVAAGYEVIIRSITQPFCQIIRNGSSSPEPILKAVQEQKTNFGYDARNEVFGDMYDTGIVDPHKVSRCALENATSSACMLLSIGCCMVDIEKENNLQDN